MPNASLPLPARPFGRTGERLPIVGLGGAHLTETPVELVGRLVDEFLTAGGRYVETAAQYGDHLSERKLGQALAGRRDRVFLATKLYAREAEAAWRELEVSLRELRTDRVDLLYIHGLTGREDPAAALDAERGTAAAVLRARREKLTRFVGVSGHWPPHLVAAVERLDLDAALLPVGLLAHCNYPETEREVLPRLRARGTAIVGMKALGDGLLYAEAEAALRYAFAQELDVLSLGASTLEELALDLAVARAARPLKADERERLLAESPFLGQYICRQCGRCEACPTGLDLARVFELEGQLDQQTYDLLPRPVPEASQRRRHGQWFGNGPAAQRLYRELAVKADACLAAGHRHVCPYGIDLARKLRLAHNKLTGENVYLV